MAQKKKKKKKKQQPQQPSRYRGNLESKTSFDKAYTAIRKVLQAYGFDPDLLNTFSKQQRRFFCFLKAEPPRFKVEEGSQVPRRLLDFASETAHRFMRTHYFGDESIGLTYLELATYGMAFMAIVISDLDNTAYSPEQLKILNLIADCFEDNRIERDLTEVATHIRKTMMMLSKVNFRIYGYTWKIAAPSDDGYLRSMVYMSSEEPKLIRFTYNGKERIAFRVRAGRVIDEPPHDAIIDRWFVYQKEMHPVVYLDIYIQSHALQRSKERMDIFPAHKRNFYIMEPLLYMHRVAKSPTGRPMLECYTQEGSKNKIVRFGYFPFIVRDNKLIVMTFLPLTSPDTTEGDYLQKNLGLQIEDTKFLGMDKLSFFLTVDFDQIPILKKALVITNIWNFIQYAKKDPDMNFSIDQKKTQMVKKFFEQKIDNENEPETFYSDIEE
jgi:hypothetical protein